jgi:hypothetical protein
MALTYFLCPSGNKIKITECLERCPNPEGRCLALPTLYQIGNVREWKGVTSTTQLLNPTRYSYLQLKYEYAVDPFEQAFSLLGIRHHKRLEIIAKRLENLIPEQYLKDGTNSGTLDLLEPDEKFPDCWKLIDYKTWGGFSVKKALDTSTYEHGQIQLQLNDYRIKAESLGLKVSRLFVQACVRDGGTMVSRTQKIDFRMKLIPIEKLPDDDVIEYFISKDTALRKALAENVTEICGYDGRWGNRRCNPKFCSVISWCKEGAAMAKVPYEGG